MSTQMTVDYAVSFLEAAIKEYAAILAQQSPALSDGLARTASDALFHVRKTIHAYNTIVEAQAAAQVAANEAAAKAAETPATQIFDATVEQATQKTRKPRTKKEAQ